MNKRHPFVRMHNVKYIKIHGVKLIDNRYALSVLTFVLVKSQH